jgi:hypothetical protein
MTTKQTGAGSAPKASDARHAHACCTHGGASAAGGHGEAAKSAAAPVQNGDKTIEYTCPMRKQRASNRRASQREHPRRHAYWRR